MLAILCALARRYPAVERLIARAFAPGRLPARACPVAALLSAPHKGADLIIRGSDGVYAVTHRVSRVGDTVVVLATVVDADGTRFDPSPTRRVADCLPGVCRAARVVGRWSLVYTLDASPIMVDPFPAQST